MNGMFTFFVPSEEPMQHIGEVKLAHFTVKEYLITVEAKFSGGDANCLIAESCLGYLMQFNTHRSLNERSIGTSMLEMQIKVPGNGK